MLVGEKGAVLLNELKKRLPDPNIQLMVAGRHLDLEKSLESQDVKDGQKVVVTKSTREEDTPDPNFIKRPHHSQIKVDPKF